MVISTWRFCAVEVERHHWSFKSELCVCVLTKGKITGAWDDTSTSALYCKGETAGTASICLFYIDRSIFKDYIIQILKYFWDILYIFLDSSQEQTHY